MGRLALLLLLAAIALAACDPEPPIEEPKTETARWAEPAHYSYDLESTCGERSLIGRFRIEVADGEVVDVVALDESATAMLDSTGPDLVPTIADLEAEALEAQDQNAEVVNVEYEGLAKMPKRIEIDYLENAIDDEACYSISNFNEGPPSDVECTTRGSERMRGQVKSVRMTVTPCEVGPDGSAAIEFTNVGEGRVSYGTPFKLERRIEQGWRWINRKQAWEMPLFYLRPGATGEPQVVGVWLGPKPERLHPGLYRVTKSFSLTPGRYPQEMNLAIRFRVVPGE